MIRRLLRRLFSAKRDVLMPAFSCIVCEAGRDAKTVEEIDRFWDEINDVRDHPEWHDVPMGLCSKHAGPLVCPPMYQRHMSHLKVRKQRCFVSYGRWPHRLRAVNQLERLLMTPRLSPDWNLEEPRSLPSDGIRSSR